MLSIIEKERIVENSIILLKELRESLRGSHQKSNLEEIIPIVTSELFSILEAEKLDHKLVDIFEGMPNWKDLEYLEYSLNKPS